MELPFLTQEAIDFLAPNHQLLSCNDSQLSSEWTRDGYFVCNRCYLLAVKRWKWHNEQKYQFELKIKEI